MVRPCTTEPKEKAPINWGDEMGMRSDHAVGRTYGKRGQTPIIGPTEMRFAGKMISAVRNLGHLNFTVFQQAFEAAVFIAFMRRLMRQNDRKCYLILDNLKPTSGTFLGLSRPLRSVIWKYIAYPVIYGLKESVFCSGQRAF